MLNRAKKLMACLMVSAIVFGVSTGINTVDQELVTPAPMGKVTMHTANVPAPIHIPNTTTENTTTSAATTTEVETDIEKYAVPISDFTETEVKVDVEVSSTSATEIVEDTTEDIEHIEQLEYTQTTQTETTETIDTTTEFATTSAEIEDVYVAETNTSDAIYVTDYEYIILCNLVAGEYGSDWVSVYDKGAVAATVIHRLWEGTRWTGGLEPTIYNVISAPYQYDGKYLADYYAPNVTESCKEAVTYALNNIHDYDYYRNPDGSYIYMINSFYGDGQYNWFRCS